MAFRWLVVLVPALLCLGGAGAAQDAAPMTRSFTVVARDGRFDPDELQVTRNDLVRITLQATDAPVSFAIDDYRLMKRAGAGETVTFSFRADRAGRFPYYCSLSSDDHCRSMRGTLVVAER
ncbi:MAG: cupredoxin domain-containing protein [Vicinamibacterales bacterium]